MSDFIPAQPGFTYIELCWYDDDLKMSAHERHPVIGWIRADNGSWSSLALLPVLMVQRLSSDEDWAVEYPDKRVVTENGAVFRTSSEWIETVKERRLGNSKKEKMAVEVGS